MAFWWYGPETPDVGFKLWNLGVKDVQTEVRENLSGFSGTPGAAAYSGEHDDKLGVIPSADDQLKGWSKAIEVLQRWLNGKQDRLAELNGSSNDDGVTWRRVNHDMGEARCLTRQSRAESWYAERNCPEGKVWRKSCPACSRSLWIGVHQKGRG
jgi:hypothetical protein